jgi:glutaredoxin 3
VKLKKLYSMQNIITIYTKFTCPYCIKAKALFERKGVSYNELNIENDPEIIKEMLEKTGGKKTVPQIFIGDTHVGGCDDLYALDGKGELDILL